ncbi:MAG: hypothetical protein KC613_12900 [Myxococcales bacterium]|nr:hypothetical protein [Myxococcales bacterium]
MDSIVKGIKMGAEDYLPKPFERVLLQARIETCLEKKQLRDREKLHLQQIEAEKRRADELLHVILPNAIVAELKATDGVQPRLYQNVAVLFADVVGFTPLAESQPAEVVVTVLNELFTLLTDIVFRHGGTIDKFIGDCVMAVWGAPNPQGDHAERALLAAEDMMRWVEAAGAGWQARFGVDLQLAIGINSGEAVVGNVGSESRMEYTAIGDAVNVAARLEGIARPNQILITRATRDAAGDGFEYAPVGRRPVTGRAEPVQLFEVSY